MTDTRTSNSPSIDPCPFCREAINPNGDESWYFRGDGPPPSYAVRCDGCGAQGPYGNGKFRKDHAGAQAEAVRLWNESARATHEPEALRQYAPSTREDDGEFLAGQRRCAATAQRVELTRVDFFRLLSLAERGLRLAQPPGALRPGLERAEEIILAIETPADQYEPYKSRLLDALRDAIYSSETKGDSRGE